MTMGKRIRTLRLQAGMTQEELGKKLGMQAPAIRKYEYGDVENIKRSTIKKLSEVFGVSPCYLMGWDEELNEDDKLAKEVAFIEELQERYGKDAVTYLSLFNQLNEIGKKKALDDLTDLTLITKYVRVQGEE